MTPDDVRRLEIGRVMDREDGAPMPGLPPLSVLRFPPTTPIEDLHMRGIAMLKRRWPEPHALEAEGLWLHYTHPDYVRIQPRQGYGFAYILHATPSRVMRAQARAKISFARAVMKFITPEADAYLGKGWGVEKYIWECAGPTDESLYPYHRDDFDGCKALKVYVYLTDCDEHNGVLEYAPCSHKASSGTFHLRPATGPKGTIVLFDPAGLHGSGKLNAPRSIFRAHLVERKYVLRHLPEQLPWYLKPVSRVIRLWNTPTA